MLYWLFLSQRFKILMEYRVNFLIGSTAMIFQQGAALLAIWVVMRHVPVLKGWRYDEVLFLYGLLTMAKSITYMFADNLWTVGRTYIRTGMFDRFLVRPIDPLFHLLADRFDHQGLGHLMLGAALVVKASLGLGLVWTPFMVGYLLLSVLSGGAIFVALNLITCVSAFWIMDSVPVTRLVFDMNEFAKYPLSIYDRSIGFLLTWVIPYGLASYYPTSYLLGREVGVMAWMAPPVAVVLLMVGYRLWLFGLAHYSGAGT